MCQRAATLLLLLASVSAACRGEQPSRPEVADETEPGDTAVFRGVYRFGFERSEFVECGAAERWWVRPATRDLSRDLVYRRLRPFDDAPDSVGLGRGAVMVSFRGRPSTRGEYGHMGEYEREFVLTDVVSMQDTVNNGCPKPAGHLTSR